MPSYTPPLRREPEWSQPDSLSSLSTPSAPTPFNTFAHPDAFSTISTPDEEYIYDNEHSQTSLRPSITTTSSRNLSTTSYPDTHLLRQFSSDSVPFSTRPVPAPPLTLRSSGNDVPSVTTSTKYDDEDRGMKQEDIDAQRLQQLGYDPVLGRDYTFWSSLAISSVNIGCLQGVIFGVYGTYNYGGPTMILVAWPISGIVQIFLTLTLAELASAYPVSGAMATWAWKLARIGVGGERAWGWLMGGVVLGGHLGNVLLVSWQICNIVEGTMSMAFDYHQQNWHSVMFFLAVMLFCGFTGSTGWGRSPKFWLACGAYFIACYLILNVSVLVSIVQRGGGHISSQYFNNTGWSSKAYVYVLGWQSCTIATGSDVSAHMAEETQRPARNVPNAMVTSMILAYIMGYISMTLLLLAVPADDVVAISHQRFPFGHILANAINPTGAIAICSLLIILLTLQVLAQFQASSRFIFALARDNAMPFADAIRWTSKNKQPVIASWVVVGLCMPFCLLTLAGKGTLYSVLTVTAGSLSFCGYIVPALLYLLSGRDLQSESRSSWSLRRFSKPCACLGITHAMAIIITQMLPSKHPVTARNISYSPVVIAGTALTCLLTWFLYGRKNYSGPIRSLTKWETGVEIDLQSALASRSKATSHAVETEFDGSKLTDTHTVTVEPAGTIDSGWTSSASTDLTSGSSSGSGSTISGRGTLSRATTGLGTVGRISEEREA